MLNVFLSIYITLLSFFVLTTVCLKFFGYNWGPLPHLYVKIVELLQNFYPQIYPQADDALWPAIIKRCDLSLLRKHHDDSLSSFPFSEMPMLNVFDVCSAAFKAGFEAIIQDQLSVAFDSAHPSYSTLLEPPGRLPFPDSKSRISLPHTFGYLIALLFRYGILLPMRLYFMLIAILIAISMFIADYFMNMTDEQKTRFTVMNCRIFCAGIGLVAKYHNRQYKPKKHGIAVANHLSPNDVQVIYADIEPSDGYAFTVTGQRQSGIVCLFENFAEKFVPTVWLDRHNHADRKHFMENVIRTAKANGPVLIFPEAYCTNNTRVLQFRKAVFNGSVVIHPIAIRQDARFGDSFWCETRFLQYLLRVFTSWAIVCDVTYLEPHQKQPDESDQEFAQRVQRAIAKTAEAESVSLDGRLWYMKSEQQRLKKLQMKNLAKCFKDLITEQTDHERSAHMDPLKLRSRHKSSSSFLPTVSTNGVPLVQ